MRPSPQLCRSGFVNPANIRIPLVLEQGQQSRIPLLSFLMVSGVVGMKKLTRSQWDHGTATSDYPGHCGRPLNKSGYVLQSLSLAVHIPDWSSDQSGM